jgi:hypothetical protein
MSKPQVVACFVIYSGEDIAYQGSFQVSEETSLYSDQSTEGGEFGFRHCYEGTQCDIEVTYSKGGSVQAQLKLEIPINRAKIKWKQSKLGEIYDVRYRCVFEIAEDSKELRKIRRRSAIARRGRQPIANIYYIGDANSNEDA